MVEKKVIKARDLQQSGVNVERLDYGHRGYHDKVYKDADVGEEAVPMEERADLVQPGDYSGREEAAGEVHGVQIQRRYDDDGCLTGLEITCRCGEVTELEFTYDAEAPAPGEETPAGESEESAETRPDPEEELAEELRQAAEVSQRRAEGADLASGDETSGDEFKEQPIANEEVGGQEPPDEQEDE